MPCSHYRATSSPGKSRRGGIWRQHRLTLADRALHTHPSLSRTPRSPHPDSPPGTVQRRTQLHSTAPLPHLPTTSFLPSLSICPSLLPLSPSSHPSPLSSSLLLPPLHLPLHSPSLLLFFPPPPSSFYSSLSPRSLHILTPSPLALPPSILPPSLLRPNRTHIQTGTTLGISCYPDCTDSAKYPPGLIGEVVIIIYGHQRGFPILLTMATLPF